MGRVNGVSQSLVALFRALGPVSLFLFFVCLIELSFSSSFRCVQPVAGNLFAWSIKDAARPFPFNFFFNYLLQVLLFGGVFALSFLLSPALNLPKAEQTSIELKTLSPGQSSSDEG